MQLYFNIMKEKKESLFYSNEHSLRTIFHEEDSFRRKAFMREVKN